MPSNKEGVIEVYDRINGMAYQVEIQDRLESIHSAIDLVSNHSKGILISSQGDMSLRKMHVRVECFQSLLRQRKRTEQ